MTNYLIEFRFSGKAKKELKQLIYDVSNKFKVKGVTSKRAVPHITLFGPFQTRNEREMVSKVVSVVKNYNIVKFKISDFSYFDNPQNKVIYVNINPSEELDELRWELSKKLRSIVEKINSTDSNRKFYFHATIAFKDIDTKFNKIWDYLKTKTPPKYRQCLLRVTILKNGKILNEYDLCQKKLLNRTQAKSKKEFSKTIKQFKSKVKNFVEKKEVKKTFLDRFKAFFKL